MLIYNDMTELIREFPVSNNNWMALDTCFVAYASELGIPPGKDCNLDYLTDPWGRRFSSKPEVVLSDDHEEMIGWTLWTSVNKQPIKCKIFND